MQIAKEKIATLIILRPMENLLHVTYLRTKSNAHFSLNVPEIIVSSFILLLTESPPQLQNLKGQLLSHLNKAGLQIILITLNHQKWEVTHTLIKFLLLCNTTLEAL